VAERGENPLPRAARGDPEELPAVQAEPPDQPRPGAGADLIADAAASAVAEPDQDLSADRSPTRIVEGRVRPAPLRAGGRQGPEGRREKRPNERRVDRSADQGHAEGIGWSPASLKCVLPQDQ
jgi:hypothetical protein